MPSVSNFATFVAKLRRIVEITKRFPIFRCCIPSGVRRQQLQRGLNIVVGADGTTRKVMAK